MSRNVRRLMEALPDAMRGATRRRRLPLAIVASLSFGFLLNGCQAQEESLDPIAIYTPERAGEGFGELLEGSLALEDGCVLLRESTAGISVVPVFPSGTEWAVDARHAVLTDGTVLRMDEVVRLGGGHVSSADPGMVVPAACPSDMELFVVVP